MEDPFVLPGEDFLEIIQTSSRYPTDSPHLLLLMVQAYDSAFSNVFSICVAELKEEGLKFCYLSL